MKLFTLLRFSIPALLVLVVSIVEGAANKSDEGVSSVWMAEKDGHHIYFAGTIHLLRDEDYPLPAVYETAYQDSTKLIFELPPDSEGNAEIAKKMQALGTYPAGDNLKKHLPPETMKKVIDWADKKKLPQATLLQMRPWFLALTMAAVEYQSLGAKPDHGVDTHYEARAKKDGKKGEGLETVEFQLSIFSNLNETLQEELLRQTFSEAETLTQDFQYLISAWRAGDADKLQEFLFRDADKYPELMEQFLIKRNQAWLPSLMGYLEKGEKVMVLVGAGHLGGKHGVLEMLKEKGCTITQVGAKR
ncbi:TraB/GumN family protein [soil metagenome]